MPPLNLLLRLPLPASRSLRRSYAALSPWPLRPAPGRPRSQAGPAQQRTHNVRVYHVRVLQAAQPGGESLRVGGRVPSPRVSPAGPLDTVSYAP